MEIYLTTSPKPEELKTISLGIQSFNEQHLAKDVVYELDSKFAVFAKDSDGQIIGGIRANAFWNYCIIELLWLSDQARGQGVGSKLMNQAHLFAKQQGFAYVRTETVDFQAKPFYEKLGYQVYGELVDCPMGHTTYCLLKKL
ncbi:GNAT family N-acetyltransferase [Thalassotalea sp. Y01]|uniref:GNAT family N-acetyltransferase n=1 Tax=Thalassotalea sp. Y01 TaxID=2729613 RepID=UPI00145D9052|nr:GNAT family N-acetyltransferase [Thalassotalea sp. Y01]NMP17476.1 GNAT family N-acetyltransferase [Thalassotalea sp. Y01]